MSADSDPNLALGAVLQSEPYELRKAHDRLRNLDVELRALPACSRDEAELVKAAVRKLVELAGEDPRLGKVYGAVRALGRPCVEQEAPGGGSLVQYVREYGLKLKVALHMAANIARGLDALHRTGVLHGNLHPGSIRIGQDGKLRLMDLGGPPPRPDASSTPWMRRYVAPERALGGAWSKPCDVYALGTILFELLAPAQVQKSVLGGDPSDDNVWYAFHVDRKQRFPGLHQFVAPLPKPISDLIQAMTDKDADRRPSAAEVFAGLSGRQGKEGARGEELEPAPEFEAPAATRLPAQREETGGFSFEGLDAGSRRTSEPTRGPQRAPGGSKTFFRLYRVPLTVAAVLVLVVGGLLVFSGGGGGGPKDPVAEELSLADRILKDRKPEGEPVPEGKLPRDLLPKGKNAQGFDLYRHESGVEFVYLPFSKGAGVLLSVGELPKSLEGATGADAALPAIAKTPEDASRLCGLLGKGYEVPRAYQWLAAAGIYRYREWFVRAAEDDGKATEERLRVGAELVAAAGVPDSPSDTSYCGARNLEGNVAEWVRVGSRFVLVGGYPGAQGRKPMEALAGGTAAGEVPEAYRGVRAMYLVKDERK